MKKIAVLISGGGTNLQSIIDAVNSNEIDAKIELVFSGKKDAYGLERAKKHSIETLYFSKKELGIEDYNRKIVEELKKRNIDLVVLAGYLNILSSDFILNFKNKIINIHPSLIPSFSGYGFHGMNVHNAVYQSGVKITGATTHFVDENVDTGYIILQDFVKIDCCDTPDSIAKKVLNIEHKILVETVKAFCEDRIEIKNNRAFIVGE